MKTVRAMVLLLAMGSALLVPTGSASAQQLSKPPVRQATRTEGISTVATTSGPVSTAAGASRVVVVPNADTSTLGNTDNAFPFNCAGWQPSMRYQQVYLGTEVGVGTITQIAFRPRNAGTAFGPTTIPGVTITLSSTSRTPATLSTNPSDNIGPDVTTVFSGNLTLSSADTGTPPAFDITIALQTPFAFNGSSSSNLLLDVTIPTCVATTQFDAQYYDAASTASVNRLYSYGSGYAKTYPDALGLVTQFTFGSVPLTVTTTGLPQATVYDSYGPKPLSAIGGTLPYTWSVSQGGLPQGAALDPVHGTISAVPQDAGTVTFRVTVTDSSSPPQMASSWLSIRVQTNQNFPPPTFNVTLGPARGVTDVMAYPHVAFVLVGNWWCPLFKNAAPQPSSCHGQQTSGPAVEQQNFVNALSNLVFADYSSDYDNGLQTFYNSANLHVSSGVGLRIYAPYGTPYSAPQANANRDTLNNLTGAFGISNQTDVDNTVFVLLYPPNTPANQRCNSLGDNASGNGVAFTTGGRPGLFGSFPTATIFLEDYPSTHLNVSQAHTCPNDEAPSAVNPPFTSPQDSGAQQTTEFATLAVSHELDEAIVSPLATVGTSITGGGWLAAGDQIADPCHLRNEAGDTGFGQGYPHWNFARDSLGTVVSAYVDLSGTCTPDASYSVPPFP